MKKTIYTLCFLTSFAIIISSCEKDVQIFKEEIVLELPEQNLDYINATYITSSIEANRQIPQLLINSGVTNEGAKLGRVLFYDTQLSLNNRISCASCHDQKSAFADNNKFSLGFENKLTTRNSMAIVNPIVNNSLFWDSRSNTIEELISEPIQNHIEMGMESMESLVKKLKTIDYYQPLFEEAFADGLISEEHTVSAMSQFLRSMVSMESTFDLASSSGFTSFSDLELRGRDIFFSEEANCSTCHSGVNFSAPDGFGAGSALTNSFINSSVNNFDIGEYAGPEIMGTANIGLDKVYVDDGFGDGQFKIPTLRNIELTSPYMHDGRYESLEEVVDHYSSNIKLHENLDDKFIVDGQVKLLDLNSSEKEALVAFLKTLTDQEFIEAERFSDPFLR